MICTKVKNKMICYILILILISFYTVKVEALESTYSEELPKHSYLNYYKTENAARYAGYKEKYTDYPWTTAIIYVNIGLDNEFYADISPITEPYRTDVLVNKYNSLNAGYIPEGLEAISTKYSKGNFMLRADSRTAFEEMCKDAAGLGLGIKAVSAYRSYKTQSSVYFSKIKKLNAESIAIRDKVSARPGHSEHQLGLAVDVVGTGSWVEGTREFAWYSQNAHNYGFIIRYPKGKEKITGYEYEPWHLRYLGVELATAVFSSGLSYDEYFAGIIDVEEKVIMALPETNIVIVDDNSFNLNTYAIGGTSYYKIRDMAEVLNGTQKRFDVYWDNENKSINFHANIEQQHNITVRNPDEVVHHTSVNEELTEKILGEAVAAQQSSIITYINEKEDCFTYYNVDGYNYLSIEEIASILNLSLSVEPVSGYIAINTMTEAVQDDPIQSSIIESNDITQD